MIEGFMEYLQMKMKVLGITIENVCNFDQTNIFFSPEAKQTLASKGCKQVSALRGESTQRCTVMLGCTANGEKFDPYIIFKGKTHLMDVLVVNKWISTGYVVWIIALVLKPAIIMLFRRRRGWSHGWLSIG
jgi:hypothetical protein